MSNYLKSTGGALTKGVGELSKRQVSGYYTGDNVDMYGHVIDAEGMLAAIGDYRTWGTVREMHEAPVGIAASIGVPEWNYMTAQISQSARGEEVLNLVRDGVYRAFSVGIIVTKAEYIPVSQVPLEKFLGLPENVAKLIMQGGEILSIREMALVEVSIVDRPANPLARVQAIQKSLAGDSLNALPAIYELNKSGADIDVLVNPRTTVTVSAEIKNALGANGSQVSPTNDTNKEVIVEEKEVVTEVIDTNGEAAAPVVDQEVIENSADDVIVEVVVDEDEFDAAEQVAADDVEESADDDAETTDVVEDVVEKEVNTDAFDFASLTERIEKLAELVGKLVEAQTVEDDAEEAAPEVEPAVVESKGLDTDMINALADAVVARIAVTVNEKRVRRSPVADVTQEPAEEVVNTKEMSVRDLSKYIAVTAAKRI